MSKGVKLVGGIVKARINNIVRFIILQQYDQMKLEQILIGLCVAPIKE